MNSWVLYLFQWGERFLPIPGGLSRATGFDISRQVSVLRLHLVDNFAQDVADQDVGFLDSRCAR